MKNKKLIHTSRKLASCKEQCFDCPISKKYCTWGTWGDHKFCQYFEREFVTGSSKIKATYCKYKPNSVKFIQAEE